MALTEADLGTYALRLWIGMVICEKIDQFSTMLD